VTLPDGWYAANQGGIELQDDDRGPQLVDAHALADMVRTAAPSARIVLLNSCYSELLAGPLCSIVDCVVGVHCAIDDDSARSFAVGFYRALGNRKPVVNCVEQALATLAAKRPGSERGPTYRLRPGLAPDQLMLGGARRSPRAGHAR
jgi:hypothetical protein